MASAKLVLTCVTNPLAIEALDHELTAREFKAEGALAAWLDHCPLSTSDLLVTARGRWPDAGVGVLGCRRHDAEGDGEPFLSIATVFVSAPARGQGVAGRMIAAAVLRAGGHGPMPRLLSVRTADPALLAVLRRITDRIEGSVMHPDPRDSVARLSTIAAARRIARTTGPGMRFEVASGRLRGGWIVPTRVGQALPRPDAMAEQAMDQILVVLDLRGIEETVLIERLRRMYRGK